MPKYLRNGSIWSALNDADAVYHDVLPPGNYSLQYDDIKGYQLKELSPFFIGRIYGNTTKLAERILHTYIAREHNTGVLAVGEKGTGKTLLSRLVSFLGSRDHNIPSILINDAFFGEEFNMFLSTIDQRAIIVFDEFEKIYHEDQDPLLTLLDGVHQSNKLFLMSANNPNDIDPCMISRPGRIFYYLEFGTLDRDFVLDYCNENLTDKSKIDQVFDLVKVYGNFSFDSLRALVEEMNRYNESPFVAIKYLNIRIDKWGDNEDKFEFEVRKDGEKIDESLISVPDFYMNPNRSRLRIVVKNEENSDDEDGVKLLICPQRIVGVFDGGKKIHYQDNNYDIFATLLSDFRFDPRTNFTNNKIQ